MRRDFINKWQCVQTGTASRSILKVMYAELTGDSSAIQNQQASATLQKLLEWILNADDGDILLDYHRNSGQLREGDFNYFWE